MYEDKEENMMNPAEGEITEGADNEPEEVNPADQAKWYVVHTYSGYENKVKANLEKIVENTGLQDYIFEIVVPMEELVEIKDGKRKVSLKKVYPGYVLVKMIITDDSWYVVRNVRGVTGFIGPEANKPEPLTDSEIRKIGVEQSEPIVDYQVGDNVRVMTGPLEGFIGVVEDINFDKKKVRVSVSMFGRETPVELEFVQIQKMY